MTRPIEHTSFLSWLMHDAELLSITTTWSDDGTLTLVLRCIINPEEDLTPLHALGILSRRVVLEMQDVWQSKIDLNGDYAPRPVIDHWEIKQITKLVRAPHGPRVKGLLHHRLTMMSGSSVDVIFGSLGIQQWSV